jgi:acetyl esterase/lipase
MAEWYIQVDGKKYGPFDSERLVKLAAAGKLTPTDRVRKGRDGQWKPASSVRRLFDAETQANYSASKEGSASKQGSASNKKSAQPAAKKPATPLEPLFDLSEAFAADAPTTDPLAPLPTPAPAKRNKLVGLEKAVDKNAPLAVKMAQLSWWIPLLLWLIGKYLKRADEDAVIPEGFLFGILGVYVIGLASATFALVHIPKLGMRRILVPAGVGFLWNGVCVALYVFILFFADALIAKLESQFQIEPSDIPYLERRAAFTTNLTHRGPAPDEYDNDPPPGEVEVVTYTSGDVKLTAWVNRSGAKHSTGNPALVYFHGGYSLAPYEVEICAPFIDKGYVVMTPMLRGENGGPGDFELLLGEVDDAKAAVQWLAEQSDIDPERIYAFGHSVGGGISALLSLMDNVPIQHSGSVGGLYGPLDFAGADDYVRFDPSVPLELEMRMLLSNLRWMNRKHYAYLGTEDDFESAYEAAVKEIADIQELTGEDAKLSLSRVAGDHDTSLAPALRQYLARIDREQRAEQSHESRAERKHAREEAKRERAAAASPQSNGRPGGSVPNPFRLRDDASENPLAPKDEPQNPFEPAGESDNRFEPATEPENPFEPAA